MRALAGELWSSYEFETEPWKNDALCVGLDPALFFPDRGGDTAQAKAVCRKCPVCVECLDSAMRHHVRFGVWGGKSERERRQMRAVAMNAPGGRRPLARPPVEHAAAPGPQPGPRRPSTNPGE